MDLSSLHSQLLTICDRYSGTVTYALTDLASGGHVRRDEEEVIPAASLIKVKELV